MKIKITSLIMAFLMIFALAGCTSSDEGTSEEASSETQSGESADLLSEILEEGVITIALEGTWSPWNYHDDDGNLVGFDVEVAQYVADYLGVEADFIEGEWDGLLAGVAAGRYDIMVNGVDITEERQEVYTFSDPYAYNRTVVITLADNDEITCMEDLEGKSTANTISSTYAELAEEYGATVTGVDDLAQTFELLLSGRIDATLNAEVTFYDYLEEHPDAEIKIAATAPDQTSVGIVMMGDSSTETLCEAVNEALAAARADGTLSALSEKYFGTDITEAE